MCGLPIPKLPLNLLVFKFYLDQNFLVFEVDVALQLEPPCGTPTFHISESVSSPSYLASDAALL